MKSQLPSITESQQSSPTWLGMGFALYTLDLRLAHSGAWTYSKQGNSGIPFHIHHVGYEYRTTAALAL